MSRRRTKIPATLGPSTDASGRLDELVAAGMDGGRIACAHDAPDEWRRRARAPREQGRRAGRPRALLADIAGPRMRLAADAPDPRRGGRRQLAGPRRRRRGRPLDAARAAPRHRPRLRVVALSEDQGVRRELAMELGVVPGALPPRRDDLSLHRRIMLRRAREVAGLAPGDLVVFTDAPPVSCPSETTHLALREVP
ncbi:pyruvate kinase [Miltoncostaea marina]|uniref:pyruvate kinase n=1 Tax=Miltoncostaea marina TaxID=2843215 RepID=UPI001C3D2DFF|nr:pyruvate kinase [Miltoncostaea marina]